MTQADLPTLLEKLRAATGGDREIDALIAYHIAGWASHHGLPEERIAGAHEFGGHWVKPGFWKEGERLIDPCKCKNICAEEGNNEQPPHYTADLSAAVALVEAKLPGAQWDVSNRYFNGDLGGRANIKIGARSVGIVSPSQTPALALLCAFIAAMGEK